MRLLTSDIRDPYFNLATEEYLLKHFNEDFFYLYLNDPCVIVGKHQNTLAEINTEFIEQSGIPVIRRLSGGGTVFHDPGNINFSFIVTGISNKISDFKKYTTPVMLTMEKFGLRPEYSNRNDLLINGLKFSGNAEHIWKNRLLHHGTVLFDADLEILNHSITSKKDVYEDKAVKSYRSQVTNISSQLHEISVQDFMEGLRQTVTELYDDCTEFTLTSYDIGEIRKLAEEKYSTWAWNFGYSPAYKVRKEISFKDTLLKIEITVSNGAISEITLTSNEEELSVETLKKALSGVSFINHDIKLALDDINMSEIIAGLEKETFVKWLF